MESNVKISTFSLMLFLGLVMVFSHSSQAFAGSGGWEDKDNDGFSTFQGDCNDDDPEVYPGQGCEPEEFIEYIIDETKHLENEYLSEGQVDGLIASLEKALERLEADQYESAAGKLNSFINKLNSYVNNGTLPEDEVEPIIEQVEMLIDIIS